MACLCMFQMSRLVPGTSWLAVPGLLQEMRSSFLATLHRPYFACLLMSLGHRHLQCYHLRFTEGEMSSANIYVSIF